MKQQTVHLKHQMQPGYQQLLSSVTFYTNSGICRLVIPFVTNYISDTRFDIFIWNVIIFTTPQGIILPDLHMRRQVQKGQIIYKAIKLLRSTQDSNPDMSDSKAHALSTKPLGKRQSCTHITDSHLTCMAKLEVQQSNSYAIMYEAAVKKSI